MQRVFAELSVIQCLSVVVVGILVAAGFVLLPRIWRGDIASIEDTAREAWLWGDTAFRGYIRGLPLAVVGSALLLFLFIESIGKEPGEDIGVVAAVAVMLFFVVLLLVVTVFLFNRPKWVVPPRFRHQPGAVHEWIGRARSRRHR